MFGQPSLTTFFALRDQLLLFICFQMFGFLSLVQSHKIWRLGVSVHAVNLISSLSVHTTPGRDSQSSECRIKVKDLQEITNILVRKCKDLFCGLCMSTSFSHNLFSKRQNKSEIPLHSKIEYCICGECGSQHVMQSTSCDVAQKASDVTHKSCDVAIREPGLISLSPSREILMKAEQTQKIAAPHSANLYVANTLTDRQTERQVTPRGLYDSQDTDRL